MIPFEINEVFMRRCFDLARLGEGWVSPNPKVGAVLVHKENIIGEGWHKKYGDWHAEVNAIQSVMPENQALIADSTLYCSLEPCFHFGKTPPCVDLILARKIPRVAISCLDPNPLVAGQSLQKMRNAGVAVLSGILESEGLALNRPFFKWITQKKPYVILKWAQSADGFLGKRGERTAISGAEALRLVHKWRTEVDAIFVGSRTALVDNPRLDNRLFPGKQPLRVALDVRGDMSFYHNLLNDEVETWILGKKRSGEHWVNTRFLPTTHGQRLIPDLLKHLSEAKKAILLVEGGADIHNQFLEQECWDEIRVLENNRLLGDGIPAPRVPEVAVLIEKIKVGSDLVQIWTKSSKN